MSLFDRLIGGLHGVPNVLSTVATTKVFTDIVGAHTFIVQTYRHPEEGDTIFLQYIADGNNYRVPIPPVVSSIVIRQHDTLTAMARRKAGRAAAEARREAGITSDHLKDPKVRAKALASRKAKAAKRRARKANGR